jgi:hypothetical protein
LVYSLFDRLKNNETKTNFKRLEGLSLRDSFGGKVTLTGRFSMSGSRYDTIITPTSRMSEKFFSVISAFLILLMFCFKVSAQSVRSVVFTTAPKTVVAKMTMSNNSGENGQDARDNREENNAHIQGKISFTVTAANEDDTLTGTLIFTLSNSAREKIAHLTGNDLKSIPNRIMKREVVANFRQGTACPYLFLIIPAGETTFEMEIFQEKMRFSSLTTEIREAPDQMSQLFCSWTRQINANRPRRGIIAAINRLINGDE